MNLLLRFRLLLRGFLLLLRRGRDAELREEMAFHREMLQADRGLSAASPEAERAFGNELLLRERARDVLGWTWLDDFFRDLKLALRRMRKRPFVVSIAILSLALGVASCATFFGLVDLLSLQPLSLPSPGRLVSVSAIGKGAATSFEARLPLSIAEVLSGRTDLFASAFAWDDDPLRTMSVGKNHFLGTVNEVSGGAFATLSEYPTLGRPIENRDVDLATGQSARVAVISYRCWLRHFGGAPDVIGKTLAVDGNPLTIIGVTGPDFSDVDRDATPDAIVPTGFGHPKSVRGYSLKFTAR